MRRFEVDLRTQIHLLYGSNRELFSENFEKSLCHSADLDPSIRIGLADPNPPGLSRQSKIVKSVLSQSGVFSTYSNSFNEHFENLLCHSADLDPHVRSRLGDPNPPVVWRQSKFLKSALSQSGFFSAYSNSFSGNFSNPLFHSADFDPPVRNGLTDPNPHVVWWQLKIFISALSQSGFLPPIRTHLAKILKIRCVTVWI